MTIQKREKLHKDRNDLMGKIKLERISLEICKRDAHQNIDCNDFSYANNSILWAIRHEKKMNSLYKKVEIIDDKLYDDQL